MEQLRINRKEQGDKQFNLCIEINNRENFIHFKLIIIVWIN